VLPEIVVYFRLALAVTAPAGILESPDVSVGR
jgi:hypothetical protein